MDLVLIPKSLQIYFVIFLLSFNSALPVSLIRI